MGDTCLLGINHGEWGGFIEARRLGSGARKYLGPANPLAFLDDGQGGAILVSGIAHLGLSAGWVDRLRRRPGGGWSFEPVVQLFAHPVAYRLDRGSPVVLLEGSVPECSGENRYVLIRVSLDGRLEALD